MRAVEQIIDLENQINTTILGQEKVVRQLLIALLANGNVLMEGLPGLAKTRAVKSLANSLKASLNRIQFTPDLLPSDVTGSEIYQPESEVKFHFQKGPIFANLVLADEINRAPAKVQAALLEAMEERQVSVAGKTYPMEALFMVLATQNPVEQEGTYPLPEAQMDRFLMKIIMEYPSVETEKKIINLVREEQSTAKTQLKTIPQEAIFSARAEIQNVTVAEPALQYMVDLVNATRYPKGYSESLARWLTYGASPRGSLALDKCSRVVAWLDNREFVTSEDIRTVVTEVLRHRLILSYEANADGITIEEVIEELIKVVAVS